MALLRFIWGILLPAWGLIALIALCVVFVFEYLPFAISGGGYREGQGPEVSEHPILSPDGQVTALFRQTVYPDEAGGYWVFDSTDLLLVQGRAQARVATLAGPADAALGLPGVDPRFDIVWQDENRLQISYCGIGIYNMNTVALLPSYTAGQAARLVETEAVRRSDCVEQAPEPIVPQVVGVSEFVIQSTSAGQ